jgi:hypothetical protein
MRQWRMLHQEIITSDKLGGTGDAAFRLFMYLVVAQDDDGNYPWTPIKRKALVIGTSWDDAKTVQLGDELVNAGVCKISSGVLSIVDGAEKQFRRKDVKAFRYDSHGNGASTARARDVNGPDTLKESKEKEIKEEEIKKDDIAADTSAPAWLNRLAKHPAAAMGSLDQDWIEQFEADFSDIDLPVEAAKFVDWWTDRDLKNWKVAWRTWCGKTQKDTRNGQFDQRVGKARNDGKPTRHSVDDRLAGY